MTNPGEIDIAAAVAIAGALILLGALILGAIVLIDTLVDEVAIHWGVGGCWACETRATDDDAAADDDETPVHGGGDVIETAMLHSGKARIIAGEHRHG
jgi:hypothetical protein